MTPPKGQSAAAQLLPERLQPLLHQLVKLNERDLALVLGALAGSEVELDEPAQAAFWKQWQDHGPQGPIEDDGEPEFP